jgi:hypothetical protein
VARYVLYADCYSTWKIVIAWAVRGIAADAAALHHDGVYGVEHN